MGENAVLLCRHSIPATYAMLWSLLIGELTCVFEGKKTQTHKNWHKSSCGMNLGRLWHGRGDGHPSGIHMRRTGRQVLSWDNLKTNFPHPNPFE